MIVNFTKEELDDIKRMAVDKAVENLAENIGYAILDEEKTKTKLIDEVLKDENLKKSIFAALIEKVNSASGITIHSSEDDED